MANQVSGPRFHNSPAPFKPLNPWGRPMPKPKREMRKTQASLYQVVVECEGKELPVGPKMQHIELAEQFCEAIGVFIGRGIEKKWSNPRIVEYKPPELDTRTLGDFLSV